MSPRLLALAGALALCTSVPAFASPHTPTDGAGVAVSLAWPPTTRATLTLTDTPLKPWLSGGWRIDGSQLDLGAGVRGDLDLHEWVRLSLNGGAAGLAGVGAANDLGARAFVEGTGVFRWRWFRVFGGPRVSWATQLGKSPEARLLGVLSTGAGVVVKGVGVYGRVEGGYAFSRWLAGGLTGQAELSLVLPLSWPAFN
jgi:hypothetical protein